MWIMKRQEHRVAAELTPQKETELRQVREKILREEKDELTALGRRLLKQYKAAQAELTRTAELLKAERNAQGLSLADISERSGISRAALCRLENLTDANPTVNTLQRIAEALGKRLIVGLQD
jgi:DNA-binding phage protein